MRTLRVAAAGAASLALAAVAAAPASAAAEGDVDVVNTETVQVYVGAEGDVESQRVYEQLALTGTGTASLANPIEESGLRNLDGFSGFSVEDGVQNLEVDVDGYERLRSVSNYDGELPLDISIEYRLDGDLVEPGDIVGENGELEVTYGVKNVTAQQQEVTFTDGKGGTVTETVEVPIPMVGSLTTVAPPGFTDVRSEQANMAGDGKGGTKLSFTMTLFPPIGSDETEFGYTAIISDGVVPASSVTALPVNPLESPSFTTAGESYQAGSDTGVQLADGATEIDANLLRLRDGASDLLSGLIQLSDGADQLNAGLAGEAAPGAVELADGAVALKDGLGQIDDGAGRLADGAGRLRAGSRAAVSGSQRLEGGLQQISGGLDQLAATEGLPAAEDGIKKLQDGVDLLLAGLGNNSQPKTLIGGLHALELGLGEAVGGTGLLAGGMDRLRGAEGLGAALGGVDQVKAGLDESLAEGGSLDRLVGGLGAVKANFCATHAAKVSCDNLVDQLILGVEQPEQGTRDKLEGASKGLGLVSTGLTTAIGTLTPLPAEQCAALAGAGTPTLRCGLAALAAGLTEAETGAGDLKQGAVDLKDGVGQVDGGLEQLSTGVTKAVAGVLALATGAGDAHAGSGDLAAGLGELSAGAGSLSDGAGELADGTGEADDGSRLLAEGAGRLSQGLGDAADGSGRLTDGLDQAAEGAPQLVDGAGRLSGEGMSQLIGAGVDTAQDYGKLYATLEAGAARADAEKMAYGAPEEATGLTAYTYELLGDDGESSRNTKRGLGALALLGLGGGAFALRRRFV